MTGSFLLLSPESKYHLPREALPDHLIVHFRPPVPQHPLFKHITLSYYLHRLHHGLKSIYLLRYLYIYLLPLPECEFLQGGALVYLFHGCIPSAQNSDCHSAGIP